MNIDDHVASAPARDATDLRIRAGFVQYHLRHRDYDAANAELRLLIDQARALRHAIKQLQYRRIVP